jgi:hypothetical protein
MELPLQNDGHTLIDSVIRMSTHASFTRRPSPVVGDLRISWRLSLLVLTLSLCCRRGQSSHKRLHLLNWAVRTPGARRQLLAALDGAQRPQDVLARTDPVLNQVIDYAAGEGLVEFPRGDRVRLTGVGENLGTSVLGVEDCFASEREFLAALGYRVTEEWVKRVMSVGVSQ